MKTLEQALAHAEHAKSVDACSESGRALTILHDHILGVPLAVTDEQIDNAAQIIAMSFNYPWKEMPEVGKYSMRDIARKVLSARPVAVTPLDYEAARTEAYRQGVHDERVRQKEDRAQPQEAKAVAPLPQQGGEQTVPTIHDAMRWSGCDPDYHGRVAFSPDQLKKFVSFFTAAAPQEPVPNIDQFIALHGHQLGKAMNIDYYDIADRDGQIKAIMLGEQDPAQPLPPLTQYLLDEAMQEPAIDWEDLYNEMAKRYADATCIIAELKESAQAGKIEAVADVMEYEGHIYAELRDPRTVNPGDILYATPVTAGAVRDAALEEAACIVENADKPDGFSGWNISEAIRALQSQPQQVKP